MTRRYATIADRLAANSTVAHDRMHQGVPCREWIGNTNNSGYPRLSARCCGQVVKLYAHRIALEQKLGRPIRRGFEADHQCVNPLCIEPAHLQEVTQRRNLKLRDQRRAA
jgi:hypothetical protein